MTRIYYLLLITIIRKEQFLNCGCFKTGSGVVIAPLSKIIKLDNNSSLSPMRCMGERNMRQSCPFRTDVYDKIQLPA